MPSLQQTFLTTYLVNSFEAKKPTKCESSWTWSSTLSNSVLLLSKLLLLFEVTSNSIKSKEYLILISVLNLHWQMGGGHHIDPIRVALFAFDVFLYPEPELRKLTNWQATIKVTLSLLLQNLLNIVFVQLSSRLFLARYIDNGEVS